MAFIEFFFLITKKEGFENNFKYGIIDMQSPIFCSLIRFLKISINCNQLWKEKKNFFAVLSWITTYKEKTSSNFFIQQVNKHVFFTK